MKKNVLLILFLTLIWACSGTQSQNHDIETDTSKKDTHATTQKTKKITVAAEQPDEYLHLLKNKKVGIVANQTARVDTVHLVDFLVDNGIQIKKVFAPEHGFRGNIDRGKHFSDEVDEKTGIPIIAMFGKNKKAKPEQFEDLDIVIFDIQDAGARFFTYISTMHYIMLRCAETKTELIVLDRPNPLGDYIDGPVLHKKYQSFVGMHPIPVVHGLTVGELALMINGEKWLADSLQCLLTVIPVANYTHKDIYSLPIKPSPNLPNDLSLRLYPSLCFFEATEISVGRGTQYPFQIVGYPDTIFGNFQFTPRDIEGMQVNPVQEGKICCGVDLRTMPLDTKFTLKYLIDFYQKASFKETFFKRAYWFKLLSGNEQLIYQIKKGLSEAEIKNTWQKDLDKYKIMRKKYLLYPDFE